MEGLTQIKADKIVYLASTYSCREEKDAQKRHDELHNVMKVLLADEPLKTEKMIYSPVLYCQKIAEEIASPHHSEFWGEFNSSLLNKADEIYLLKSKDWWWCEGVMAEIRQAMECKKKKSFFAVDLSGIHIREVTNPKFFPSDFCGVEDLEGYHQQPYVTSINNLLDLEKESILS